MIWKTSEQRLALLELLVQGRLRRREAQSNAYEMLAELPWTRSTGRRDQIALVEAHRLELATLLDRVWPLWREVLSELTVHGLAPTPEGWSKLEDARRAAGLSMLPERLNRRTAAALTAPHSKASLTQRRLAALGDVETTSDGLVRIRPPSSLLVRTSMGAVDLAAVAKVLGEVGIPQRACQADLAFEGAVRGILLVENPGAWRDFPALEGWLLAHVPGWDTATIVQFLDCMARVPVVHFGDLDPNGVRIYQHLRKRRPDLRWFIPSFWHESIETKGLPASWPDDLELGDAPELVRELVGRNLWLEQESLVVDPRIGGELEAMVLVG